MCLLVDHLISNQAIFGYPLPVPDTRVFGHFNTWYPGIKISGYLQSLTLTYLFFVPSKTCLATWWCVPGFPAKVLSFSKTPWHYCTNNNWQIFIGKKLVKSCEKHIFTFFLLIFYSKLWEIHVSWSLTKISWFRDAKNGRDHVKSWSRDFTVQALYGSKFDYLTILFGAKKSQAIVLPW